jgi:uncharacterized zinc-type alcohol dehydrogenase-like protein
MEHLIILLNRKTESMIKTIGYGAKSEKLPLEPIHFERRTLTDFDVEIKILYCSLCHSDISIIKNEWVTETSYPIIPGHEIIGQVAKIGNKVTSYKTGDIVAPTGIIDSCGNCSQCLNHLEQFCEKGYTFTFNAPDKYIPGQMNYGGFSKIIIANEKFIVKIPQKLQSKNLASLAPLLCAGMTTFSAFKHWNIGKNHKVAVVGIGGLGHLAVKIAHALGAQVTMITTSPHKMRDAKKLGAINAILSTNVHELKTHEHSFDFILNTIPVSHDLNIYLDLLKIDGTMCLIGIPQKPHGPISINSLIWKRRSLSASQASSIEEIKEMLEFCADHNILADVEIISIQDVNKSIENVIDKKIHYRYVIDMSTL